MDFMLSILPGEIFFSWVSRMYAISGKTASNFLFELLGTKKLFIHQIKLLRVRIDKEIFMKMLYQHSVLTAMKPFMLEEKYNKLINSILNKEMYEICWDRKVKVCLCCYKEDLQKYGQAYLRIEHQVGGNCLCYKHHVDLIAPVQYIGSTTQKLFKSNLVQEELVETFRYNIPLYQDISYMLHMICNNYVLENMNLEKVQEKYKARIKELGEVVK